jgi:hypothetical protein
MTDRLSRNSFSSQRPAKQPIPINAAARFQAQTRPSQPSESSEESEEEVENKEVHSRDLEWSQEERNISKRIRFLI